MKLYFPASIRPWIARRLPMLLLALPLSAHAQLFENLHAFDQRLDTGDPETSAAFGTEGPKGITTADFNGDGHHDLAVSNLDGSITILPGRGDGTFGESRHLPTFSQGLRQIVSGDWNGDGRPDLAAAAPFDGDVFLFLNTQGDAWTPLPSLTAGPGARNLAAGDFDGDGHTDLAVAGPGLGLLYYRGFGNGSFVLAQDLPQLSPVRYDFPKPVFTLLALPAAGGSRDDLIVTHADSPRTWILSAAEPGPALGAESLLPGEQQAPIGAEDTPLLITEIMAANTSTLADEQGFYPDWIELHNRGSEPLLLAGWGLTDNPDPGARWFFPAITLQPGAFLVVFASGSDHPVQGPLHVPFRLNQDGEYLALLDQSGQVVQAFDPELPPQAPDISYGLSRTGVSQFFDLPTPGRANVAGEAELEALQGIRISSVQFEYPPESDKPSALQVVVEQPERLNRLWFSFTLQGLELPRLMAPLPKGIFRLDLAGDAFTSGLPYRFYGEDTTGAILNLNPAPQVAPGEHPSLHVVACLPTHEAHSLDAAPITRPAAAGIPDLISANRDTGALTVLRGVESGEWFSHIPHQVLSVPGGPRALRIIDLDGDGWNDLVVVLRNHDRVLTYHNEQGSLVPRSELPAGASPREIAIADFNEDGSPDGAVINRLSADVSILSGFPGTAGFGKLDQIYATDGEVVALRVADFNGDGRDDVFQLHRQARDYSVRYSQSDGTLDPPVHFSLGDLPSASSLSDVDGDGRLDVVAVNIAEPGSVSVRLALPDGEFAPEQRFTLSGTNSGGLFALVPGDFDGDGKTDLAAGYFDCRITFFRGNGDGTFTSVRTDLFTYESRAMITGDFDQDGDTDLAGAGYAGNIVVIENTGDLFTIPELPRLEYPPASEGKFGATELLSSDIDGDGDPDLIMGSGQGIVVYFGAEGVRFDVDADVFPEVSFPVSGLAEGDFDGNGSPDLAVACRILSCIMLYTKNEAGEYRHALTADVPAAAALAAGDLDGDGLTDLVGSGDVLWTALSSRRSRTGPSTLEPSGRRRGESIVINEILAINNKITLGDDYGKKPDWIELYHGGNEPLTVTGWSLQLINALKTLTYFFPEGATLEPGSHKVVVFSEQDRGPWHTGFRIPGEGGTLVLLDPEGQEADRVAFPPQQENVSYARYADGLPSFVANAIPTPGGPNTDNGPVEPAVEFLGFDLNTLRPGVSIVARARASDDIGLMSLCLLYRRVDINDPQVYRAVLFDDGMHDDEGRLDGSFTGTLDGGLPHEAEIRFVLEGVDLSGKTVIVPGGGGFDGDDGLNDAFSLALNPGLALQLSEVVADNRTGLQDESGGTPDYIEIRNTGAEPVSLDGISLARNRMPDPEDIFTFPRGLTLHPGEHIVIYADNNLGQGLLHAPFRIDRSGDFFLLTAPAAQGGVVYLDEIFTPSLSPDQALYRIGDRWLRGRPSPLHGNLTAPLFEIRPNGEGLWFAFPTRAGWRSTVEFSPDLTPDSWTDLLSVPGTGLEEVLEAPIERSGFLRVRETPEEAP